MSPSQPAFAREPLPPRLCNLDRLLHAMDARGLDAIVASTRYNAYQAAARDLGGFVRDPGAMVWGYPRGAEPRFEWGFGPIEAA